MSAAKFVSVDVRIAIDTDDTHKKVIVTPVVADDRRIDALAQMEPIDESPFHAACEVAKNKLRQHLAEIMEEGLRQKILD